MGGGINLETPEPPAGNRASIVRGLRTLLPKTRFRTFVPLNLVAWASPAFTRRPANIGRRSLVRRPVRHSSRSDGGSLGEGGCGAPTIPPFSTFPSGPAPLTPFSPPPRSKPDGRADAWRGCSSRDGHLVANLSRASALKLVASGPAPSANAGSDKHFRQSGLPETRTGRSTGSERTHRSCKGGSTRRPKNGPLPLLRSGFAPWRARRGNGSNKPAVADNEAGLVEAAGQRLEHARLCKNCPSLPTPAPPPNNAASSEERGGARRQPAQENQTSQSRQTRAS
jgi:hypothetical protein